MDEEEIVAALSGFQGVWQHLLPLERARVVALLLEKVEFNGAAGTVALVFRPNGLKSFANEMSADEKGAK